MPHRNVSEVILYTDDGKLLLQDREGIAKFGEKYALFGGGIEDGETPREAMERELKEELNYEFEDLEEYKVLEFRIDENNTRTYHIFQAKAPELDKIEVLEGKEAKFFTFEEALKQNLFPGDHLIIREFGKLKGFLQ
ncbi:NUDIX hydrolase [Candidatus Woesearchaeota archaeon]|nr:NUDIX hydrolase [Candidatus Woesearchaeota archaeon]